jgi:hypothetical protein
MLINKPLILSGSTATTGYTIDQSIRFNPADSTVMTKTYSGAGNRKKWTFSTWFKLGSLNGMTAASNLYYVLFACDSATNDAGRGIFSINNNSGDSGDCRIQFEAHSTMFFTTTRTLKDPSAWYHITLVFDSDNAVAQDRARLYINGERVTSFVRQTNPTAGMEIGINTANAHRIGAGYGIGSGTVIYHFDGYMADIHFLDGYSYGPEYFGETNSSGLWIPKEYDDSYGSNGFKIDGRDSSDLGDDESGNGNDYTTSGLAAHDQVSDTPTNNFAVLNPVDTFSKLAGELRNGNLELKDNSASVYVHGRATFGFDVTDSDGWYWESCDVVDGSQIGGITEDNAVIPSGSDVGFTGARGSNSVNTNYWYKLDGTTYSSTSLGVNSNAGDIAQFCVKNGKLFIGINGTYVLSGNPATEANPLFTGLTGTFMPFGGLYSGFSYNTVYNFGQDGTFAGNKTAQGNTDANGHGNFFYAPPSGAKALCSKSLGS